jgi:hypothetical protein
MHVDPCRWLHQTSLLTYFLLIGCIRGYYYRGGVSVSPFWGSDLVVFPFWVHDLGLVGDVASDGLGCHWFEVWTQAGKGLRHGFLRRWIEPHRGGWTHGISCHLEGEERLRCTMFSCLFAVHRGTQEYINIVCSTNIHCIYLANLSGSIPCEVA